MTFLKPAILLLCAAASLAVAAETRYHQLTARFANPPDGAEVISAGFFGGKGNEWLAAGGFAPDGAVVLAGNVAGADFMPAEVVGTDLPPPPDAKRQPDLDGKGRQKTDKDGTPLWKKPSWADPDATGFLIRASADLKTTLSVHRLPWRSASITDCEIAQDGAIYIAGKASREITSLGGDIQSLTAADNGLESASCDHTFIAKLAPDASKVEWLRHLKGPSNAPQLELMSDGSLVFTAQDLRNISTDGEELGRVVFKGGLGHLSAVNPRTGHVFRGGEHHSPTGREPWRCPILDLYDRNGLQLDQLYDWLGPYVGLDNLRLVSDTAVRRVTFDPWGNLMLVMWSDGGNSVAVREPFDVRTPAHGFGGLGFSNWGAGVLSNAYLLRLDPQTCRVREGTLWLAYLESDNKPNSAWIDQLGFAPDGSICFTGRAASSVIQTQNRISPCQKGQHVVILNDDMSSIRFSSTVPGSGMAVTGNADETWGIASRSFGRKQRVLFLTGAGEGEDGFKTPVVNAGQSTFGGGWMDGYALLLEMDANPASKPVSPAEPVMESRDPVPSHAAGPGDFIDSKQRGPGVGQTFDFKALNWVTVDAEFRDGSGALRPSFFYGKPKSGSFKFDPASPELKCVLECEKVCQPNGDLSRRVMGEWTPEKGGSIDFSFEIRSVGPFQVRAGNKDKVLFAMADAIMKAKGRSFPVQAECSFQFRYPQDGTKPDSVQIDARFTTSGRTLGLENPKAAGDIKVRVSGVAVDASASR